MSSSSRVTPLLSSDDLLRRKEKGEEEQSFVPTSQRHELHEERETTIEMTIEEEHTRTANTEEGTETRAWTEMYADRRFQAESQRPRSLSKRESVEPTPPLNVFIESIDDEGIISRIGAPLHADSIHEDEKLLPSVSSVPLKPLPSTISEKVKSLTPTVPSGIHNRHRPDPSNHNSLSVRFVELDDKNENINTSYPKNTVTRYQNKPEANVASVDFSGIPETRIKIQRDNVSGSNDMLADMSKEQLTAVVQELDSGNRNVFRAKELLASSDSPDREKRYIPYAAARKFISEMCDDMENMRADFMIALNKIDANYRAIEQKIRKYFIEFMRRYQENAQQKHQIALDKYTMAKLEKRSMRLRMREAQEKSFDLERQVADLNRKLADEIEKSSFDTRDLFHIKEKLEKEIFELEDKLRRAEDSHKKREIELHHEIDSLRNIHVQDSPHVAAIKDKEVDGNELCMTNNVHRNGDRDASQREFDQLRSRFELLLADRDKQIQALQRDYNEVISLQLPKIEQNGTAEFPSAEFSDLNTDTDLIASSPNLQVIHHQLLSSRSRAETAEHKLFEKELALQKVSEDRDELLDQIKHLEELNSDLKSQLQNLSIQLHSTENMSPSDSAQPPLSSVFGNEDQELSSLRSRLRGLETQNEILSVQNSALEDRLAFMVPYSDVEQLQADLVLERNEKHNLFHSLADARAKFAQDIDDENIRLLLEQRQTEISELRDLYEEAKSVSRTSSRQLKVLQDELSPLREENEQLRSEISDLRSHIDRINQAVPSPERNMAGPPVDTNVLQQAEKEIQRLRAELRKAKEQAMRASNQAVSLAGKSASEEKQQRDSAPLDDSFRSLHDVELSQELLEARNKIAQLLQENEEMRSSRLPVPESNEQTTSLSVQELSEELENVRKNALQVNEELQTVRREREHLEREIASLRSTGSSSSESLSNAQATIQQLEKLKTEQEEEKKSLFQQLELLEADAEELRRLLSDSKTRIVELEEEISAYQDRIESFETKITEVQAALAQERSSLSNTKAHELELENQLQATQILLKESELQLASAQNELASASVRLEQLYAVETELANTKKELERVQYSFEDAQHRLQIAEAKRKKIQNELQELKGGIRVFARIRPLNSRERGDKSIQEKLFKHDQYTLRLEEENLAERLPYYLFEYTHVFGPKDDQFSVYNEVKPLVSAAAIDGYKVCVFAYGQTGSGKTFTMSGDPNDPEIAGLLPRAVRTLFEELEQHSNELSYDVSVSMLELYLDRPEDRLCFAKKDPPQLKILGSGQVDRLEILPVSSAEQILDLFDRGNKTRHVRKTKMNDESSRSHTLYSVYIHTENRKTKKKMNGKLLLVDLAGSERSGRTGVEGEGMKEANAINKSLSALKSLISHCATGKPVEKFSHRSNPLTMLLKDVIGGDAKTLMFVNVSPASDSVGESKNSLQYGREALDVKNNVVQQVEDARYQKLQSQFDQVLGTLTNLIEFSLQSGLDLNGTPFLDWRSYDSSQADVYSNSADFDGDDDDDEFGGETSGT